MKIQLSDHFSYSRLLRFALPSIIMMIFTSIYGVVDGIFVSNFAGKIPFTAINLIMPYVMVFGAVGFMVGTGGTALIAKTLGMGDRQKANEIFSMLTYICVVSGVVLTVLSIVFLRPAAVLLGAQGEILENCVLYGRIVLLSSPAYILQFAFQSFCVTAEKSNLSLVMTVASGVCNRSWTLCLLQCFIGDWWVQRWQLPLHRWLARSFQSFILQEKTTVFSNLESSPLMEKRFCIPVPTAPLS